MVWLAQPGSVVWSVVALERDWKHGWERSWNLRAKKRGLCQEHSLLRGSIAWKAKTQASTCEPWATHLADAINVLQLHMGFSMRVNERPPSEFGGAKKGMPLGALGGGHK